jgi:hypothetical protein
LRHVEKRFDGSQQLVGVVDRRRVATVGQFDEACIVDARDRLAGHLPRDHEVVLAPEHERPRVDIVDLAGSGLDAVE